MTFGIVKFIANQANRINQTVTNVSSITDKIDKDYSYLTKLFGGMTGGAGFGRGASDFVKAVACQDGVCAVVSAEQVIASFGTGANVTTLITMPISAGCKVFVWSCRGGRLPWKHIC